MINSKIQVKNFNPNHLQSLIKILKKMGANMDVLNSSIKIYPSKKLKSAKIETAPLSWFSNRFTSSNYVSDEYSKR